MDRHDVFYDVLLCLTPMLVLSASSTTWCTVSTGVVMVLSWHTVVVVVVVGGGGVIVVVVVVGGGGGVVVVVGGGVVVLVISDDDIGIVDEFSETGDIVSIDKEVGVSSVVGSSFYWCFVCSVLVMVIFCQMLYY
jgi:hypothetical protein